MLLHQIINGVLFWRDSPIMQAGLGNYNPLALHAYCCLRYKILVFEAT